MKEIAHKIISSLGNFFKYNRQFLAFVILSLMSMTLIRITTVGNIWWIQPLLIDLALIILLGSLAYLFTPRKQFIYLFILMLIFTLINIINAVYFSFFNSFTSVNMLGAVVQAADVSDAIIDGLRITHFVYLIFPLIFYLIYRHLKNRDFFSYVTKFEKSLKILFCLLLVGSLLLVLVSFSISSRSRSRLTRHWYREYVVQRFGMVGYKLSDVFTSLIATFPALIGQDVAIRNFEEHFYNHPLRISNNEYTEIFVGKNLVFIHMESIASFLIDLEINNREVTPNLNRIAAEGIYFSNFFPQVGRGNSSDAEFSLLTSLIASTRGFVFINYVNREFNTIPWILRERGYYTFSMHGNNASMWNRGVAHPRLGYMDFYSANSFDQDEVIGLGVSDKSFFRQAIPMLERIEQTHDNYMGKIITLTHHTPFKTYPQFSEFDLTYTNQYGETFDFLSGTRMGRYMISAHYADEAIGLFLEMIEESDYFENTVFVFYGDHDPRFNRNDYHNLFNFNPLTGELLTPEDEDYMLLDDIALEIIRKTPLIIWTPNQQFNQTYDYPIGAVDIMPTIGNMMGFRNEFALGNDIFEIREDNIVIFPNGNFLTNKVFFYNRKEIYRVFRPEDVLDIYYIAERRTWSESILSLSRDIIVHDLIRRDLEARALKEES